VLRLRRVHRREAVDGHREQLTPLDLGDGVVQVERGQLLTMTVDSFSTVYAAKP